jgi:hypothetical protein
MLLDCFWWNPNQPICLWVIGFLLFELCE